MRHPILFINAVALVILAFILGLNGCGKRDISSEIIKIYNSEMKATSKFSPLETLYVGINGLQANKMYKIEAIDPDGQTISELSAETDDKGNITATPLWYDVGLRKADDTHPTPWIDTTAGLSLRAFYIKVSSSDGKTDFKQAFYFVYKPSDITEKAKTIAYASDASGGLSNTFEEAGSQQYNALDQTVTASDKTKVYVTLDNLDSSVTDVDVYLLPYDGTKLYANGNTLPAAANKVASLNIATQFAAVTGTTAKVSTAPIWDINTTPPPGSVSLLTNPNAVNTAYTVMVITKTSPTQSRTTLKLSDIVNGKNVSVTDAIDGNSVPGFIVLNTPANDIKFSITDNLGNKTAALVAASPANTIDANRILRLNVDNVPVAPGSSATVYVIPAGSEPLNGAALPADVRGATTTALVNPPSAGDLRLLPYISNANLLTTSTSFPAAYRYLSAVAIDTQFDVIVKFTGGGTYTKGSDLYIAKAATVKPFVASTSLATFSATATSATATYFDETGTLGGLTKVYVNFTTTGVYPTAVNTYLYKGNNSWVSGTTTLTSPLLTKSLNFSAATNHTAQFWDLDVDYQVINPVADPASGNFHAYDIIVDLNNNGKYDAGEKLTVVINDTSANTYPRVIYTNIASSGIFTYNASGTNFGYDDLFDKTGSGTNWASHSTYTGYGIKAIWNPYLQNYNGNKKVPNLSKYEGQSVDVYIVDATAFNLKNWQTKKLTNADDVTGYHKTIPVQSGCSNGYYQNNIWTASSSNPMKIGNYYVIVDMNRDGMITEGVDLIDAVKNNEKTILDDPGIVGFSVY